MEVKGQLTSTSDPVTCPERKHKERMAELQERRRGLQALLSTRLAELRRICLQEVELTGAVPTDFPLEAGEKPTCVRRRGGTSRQGNRKSRSEDEDSQRSKPKKNLFSGALRKHNDPEHNTHIHTHHGKRTVHRGCHTDTVRSESSSTSDSPGIENDDGGSRPLLVSSGSPVVLFQNKTRRSSLHIRTDLPETLQTLKPLPLHPPPPRSQDSSSGPSEGRGGEGLRGEWSGEEGRGGAAYSDVLLDYVWGKQQQLHLQQPHSRHPIASQHELLFHGSSPEPLGAPPTYRDQRRVTRTKSCGPFLPVQQGQSPPAAIQPDPHPHLLPPAQDAQLEDATRTLHKALALEGLRDWYLRNTNGSTHPNQANGKVNAGVNTKVNWGVKGQAGGGGALQSRRRTRGVLHHELQAHQKTLTHSATSHGRYVDSSPPQEDQPSPGTLV